MAVTQCVRACAQQQEIGKNSRRVRLGECEIVYLVIKGTQLVVGREREGERDTGRTFACCWRPFTHSAGHWESRPLIDPLMHSFIQPFICSLICSFITGNLFTIATPQPGASALATRRTVLPATPLALCCEPCLACHCHPSANSAQRPPPAWVTTASQPCATLARSAQYKAKVLCMSPTHLRPQLNSMRHVAGVAPMSSLGPIAQSLPRYLPIVRHGWSLVCVLL